MDNTDIVLQTVKDYGLVIGSVVSLTGTLLTVAVAFVVMRHTAEASRYKLYLESYKLAKDANLTTAEDEIWAKRVLRLVDEHASQRVVVFYLMKSVILGLLAYAALYGFGESSMLGKVGRCLLFGVMAGSAVDALYQTFQQGIRGDGVAYSRPRSLFAGLSLTLMTGSIVVVLCREQVALRGVPFFAAWIGIVILGAFTIVFGFLLYRDIKMLFS